MSKEKKQYGWRHVFGIFALAIVFVWLFSDDSSEAPQQSALHRMVNGTQHTQQARQAPEPKPVVKVTSRQLARECDKNEIAFLEKYKDKRLEVKGKVVRIDSGLLGDPVIHLRGLNQFNTVMVDGLTKEFAKTLSKGDILRTWCDSVDEVLGSPSLRDCGGE